MSLAKDLLNLGERDTVLEFFTLCRSFWKQPLAKLDDWTAMVKGLGGIPECGPHSYSCIAHSASNLSSSSPTPK